MRFPQLTDRDRRTIRLASIGLGLYLLAFFGFKILLFLGERRATYTRLRQEATALRQRFDLYQSRAVRLERLMVSFQMDPARLNSTTLVADASAALQQTATQGGLQVGPVRETLSLSSEREMGPIQLEASGQVPQLMTFLHQLRGLGYPLVIDSLQISPEQRRPGFLKINLGLILLNYQRWNEKEETRA